jgi:hypothetical protein
MKYIFSITIVDKNGHNRRFTGTAPDRATAEAAACALAGVPTGTVPDHSGKLQPEPIDFEV